MNDFLESFYKKYRKTNNHTISAAKRSGMSFVNQQPNSSLESNKTKLSEAINAALKS